MKLTPVQGALWTIACALLFYWFIGFTAKNLIEIQHNPIVTHYQHKFCPAPAAGRG